MAMEMMVNYECEWNGNKDVNVINSKQNDNDSMIINEYCEWIQKRITTEMLGIKTTMLMKVTIKDYKNNKIWME